ncbi:hypothetical protein [Marixanthomonas ophiurae]|uniref:DUF4157 domain-containing protein n=1 Tax=Marixanthomonas ophiurae TaxID=387659 RepID=A0A3E1Q9F5_9FLAO|nr:hypothetical protein [Marixanthomonas ophiurae]RFN58758.1 hypothetical protein DZ858_01360 [Marixanthomonas ophiurae]
MIILVNRFLLRKKFVGIALWPFLILKDHALKTDVVFMNHERIHLRQQIELLVVFFYLWYGVEYVIRLLQYRNRYTAYRNISFEREAYAKEKDIGYLQKRPFWVFLSFL